MECADVDGLLTLAYMHTHTQTGILLFLLSFEMRAVEKEGNERTNGGSCGVSTFFLQRWMGWDGI